MTLQGQTLERGARPTRAETLGVAVFYLLALTLEALLSYRHRDVYTRVMRAELKRQTLCPDCPLKSALLHPDTWRRLA